MVEIIFHTLQIIATIVIWELFAKDFITWEGFGTPFRRKNRPENMVNNEPAWNEAGGVLDRISFELSQIALNTENIAELLLKKGGE